MPPKPRIITSSLESWCKSATDAIGSAVRLNIKEKGECSLMLTGGNTAKQLYKHWASTTPWNHSKIKYYFGDERCVPPDNEGSNYGMVKQNLFPNGIPDGCTIIRIKGEMPDLLGSARIYEQKLSESIDILLLTVGPDGHISSLFPDSIALQEKSKSVIPVESPKPPHKRLTISKLVIKSAKSTFLFARGEEKGRILAKALGQPYNTRALPVRLVLGSTWILDSVASEQLE